MKFFLLSDNTDTQMGMRLVGIEGVVIHTRDEVLEALEKVVDDEEIAIVLITTKLVELCPNVISELKLKQKRPLIVEISDRHGSANVDETLDRYVSEAIGVDLEE
jgi:V/A-type H+-transporting ATPase subunit F